MQMSLICVYNDEETLRTQLLKSLSDCHVKCEQILIDNTSNRFKSAAAALNYGASKARGDVLVFAHQDIFIKYANELENFGLRTYELPVGSVVGAQGAIEGIRRDISNLTAGETLSMERKHEIDDLREASCIDEGLFAVRKETYDMYKFNEHLCTDWHLYAVEWCLHARACEGKVYIDPIQIHHFSWGHITEKYMKNLIVLADFYRPHFKYIWTTCYKVKTNWLSIRVLYLIWCLNRIIRRKRLN